MYVLLLHLSRVPEHPPVPPNWLAHFVLLGHTGVTLFFVISAFTLASSMKSRSKGPPSLFSFYLRRFFRIAPLCYFWLAILGPNLGLSWKVFGINLAFLYNLFPSAQQGIVWASWTLSVEMIFYLIFPFLFRVFDTWKKTLLLFFITVALAGTFEALLNRTNLGSKARDEYFTFHVLHHIQSFAFGMFCFFIHDTFGETILKRRLGVYLLIGAFVTFALFFFGFLSFYPDDIFWRTIIYGLLLLGLLACPVRPFVNRVTCFYGRISYSLYLNHPFLLFKLSFVFTVIAGLGGSQTLLFLLSCMLAFLVITPCACVTYVLIEEPGVRFGNWLIKRKNSAVAATETVIATSP